MPRLQGAIRQKGEKWGYRLRHAGRDRRIGGFATEEEATLALAAERLRIVKEEATGVRVPDRVTFAGFRSTFLPLLQTNRSPSWVRTSIGHFDIMARRIGARVLCDLTRSDVEDLVTWLVAERGVAPSTTNRYLSTLSAVMSAAKDRNLCLSNPVSGVRKAREEAKAVPWISIEDLRRLESCIPEEYRAFCVLASETGMRRGELAALEWRDVSLERRSVVVRKSKSKRPREIPLSMRAVVTVGLLMAARLPTPLRGPDRVFPGVDVGRLSCEFPRWAKAAGLKGLTVHSLRHGWASRLVRSGADLATVMRLGGWASLSLVQRYGAHAPVDAGRRAIEAMESAEAPAKKERSA